MNTIVSDSDGLIKLMKSGCLINILTSFECSITEDVFNETVVQGMERLYEDAYGINKLIEQSKLKVEKIIDNKYAKKILADKTFGAGECSTLHLYLNSGAKAIITDDRAFLNLLDKSEIPFIIPTDLIVRLYELKVISKDESIKALDRIKEYVSVHNYNTAIRNLEV